MKNRILVLFVLLTITSHSSAQITPPITTPTRYEWVIYGPRGSLIGVARQWWPTFFYPIAPELRPFLNPLDTLILYSGPRMDSVMRSYQITNWRMTDTYYMPVKIKQAK
jgi:hypothetical protein